MSTCYYTHLHHLLPDVAQLADQTLDGLGPHLLLGQRPGADVGGPDQRQEPLVGRHLAVLAALVLVARSPGPRPTRTAQSSEILGAFKYCSSSAVLLFT